MKYASLRGMEDILPDRSRAWQAMESAARKSLESFGFTEIRTPLLEDTALFERSIGEGTDIVTKEMFTFLDRKERSLTLRPEGTASCVRAFIEHSLGQNQREVKLYYIGPMFRAERPQKGRQRQFHQIGTEVIGVSSPYADAEVIAQLDGMLKALGLKDFTLKINNIGCRDDKQKYSGLLRGYLDGNLAQLCDDCKARAENNPLRVLDCKNASCKAMLQSAPPVAASVCGPCAEHYGRVKDTLAALGVAFTEETNLVRGLDYYTKTVFEVTSKGLGSQDAIGAGGRYDNLVRELGGPDMGAIGYAVGMERVLLSLGNDAGAGRDVIYVATMGAASKAAGFKLARDIREATDVIVVCDTKDASLKSQLRTADSLKAKITVIIGEQEIAGNAALVKDMEGKEQSEVPFAGLAQYLAENMKKKKG